MKFQRKLNYMELGIELKAICDADISVKQSHQRVQLRNMHTHTVTVKRIMNFVCIVYCSRCVCVWIGLGISFFFAIYSNLKRLVVGTKFYIIQMANGSMV